MTFFRRRLLIALPVLVLLGLLAWLRPGIDRSPWTQLGLLDPGSRVENFRHMERIFPSRTVAASTQPTAFPRAARLLPTDYPFDGATRQLGDFLTRTQTTGLLVLKDGVILHEEYRQGAGPDSRFTSWSIAKSYVATLIGIALKDGALHSLDDKVTVYLPHYAGTAWADASLRDLLRMSSGVTFDERYAANFSDIQRVFHAAYLFHEPLSDIVRGYGERAPAFAPGTRMHYISINTQVLAEVLRAATGKPVAAYLQEKLWQPLGAEDAATWSVDAQEGDAASEMGFCCLGATLRDYARLGQLYLQQGQWNGQLLLPADWVRESTRRSEPWLQPGVADPERGYGYHWWIPPAAEGEYFANGIWGQAIWVDERSGVVIVKTSVDPNFQAHLPETIAALRAIARGLAEPATPYSAAPQP